MNKLIVQDTLVSLTRVNDDDCISLTDIARVISPLVGASLLANKFVRFASKLAPTMSFRIDGCGINNAAIKGVESEKITLNNPLEISPLVGASLLAKEFFRFASKLAPTMCFRIDGLSGINNAAIKGGESEKITPNNPLEISPLVGASLLAKKFVGFASELAPTRCFRIDGLSGINNAAIRGVESDPLRLQAGCNSFTLSPTEWIGATAAIGIKSSLFGHNTAGKLK